MEAASHQDEQVCQSQLGITRILPAERYKYREEISRGGLTWFLPSPDPPPLASTNKVQRPEDQFGNISSVGGNRRPGAGTLSIIVTDSDG